MPSEMPRIFAISACGMPWMSNIVTTARWSWDSFCMDSFNRFCSSPRSASRTGVLPAVSSMNSLSFCTFASMSSRLSVKRRPRFLRKLIVMFAPMECIQV